MYEIGFMSCMASLLLHDACFWRSFGCEPFWAKLRCRPKQCKPNAYSSLMPMQTQNLCITKICPSAMLASYMLKISHEFSRPLKCATCRFFYRRVPVPYVTRHSVTITHRIFRLWRTECSPSTLCHRMSLTITRQSPVWHVE